MTLVALLAEIDRRIAAASADREAFAARGASALVNGFAARVNALQDLRTWAGTRPSDLTSAEWAAVKEAVFEREAGEHSAALARAADKLRRGGKP